MTRPGHDGIPPQGPEFAEFLRRELHAAADQLEPRSDGLERIRARVRRRLLTQLGEDYPFDGGAPEGASS